MRTIFGGRITAISVGSGVDTCWWRVVFLKCCCVHSYYRYRSMRQKVRITAKPIQISQYGRLLRVAIMNCKKIAADYDKRISNRRDMALCTPINNRLISLSSDVTTVISIATPPQ